MESTNHIMGFQIITMILIKYSTLGLINKRQEDDSNNISCKRHTSITVDKDINRIPTFDTSMKSKEHHKKSLNKLPVIINTPKGVNLDLSHDSGMTDKSIIIPQFYFISAITVSRS